MFVVPLSDNVVDDSLNRFTSRSGKGGDLPRGQCPCPGRVTPGGSGARVAWFPLMVRIRSSLSMVS